MKLKLAVLALTVALSPAAFAEAPETISTIPFGTGASGQTGIPIPALPAYTPATAPARYQAGPEIQTSGLTTKAVRTHLKVSKKDSTR